MHQEPACRSTLPGHKHKRMHERLIKGNIRPNLSSARSCKLLILLMQYAMPHALQAMLSFYQTLFVAKVAPRWLLRIRTDIATFALAMAAIMHCYSDSCGEHRDIFRSKYLNVRSDAMRLGLVLSCVRMQPLL